MKIWFQNRQAKEHKVNQKKQQQQHPQQPSLPTHDVTPPTPAVPPFEDLCPSSTNLLGAPFPSPVKEEYAVAP